MNDIITGTAEQVIEAILGPQQHDRHVQKRRFEQKMAARHAHNDAGLAAVKALVIELAARKQGRK